MPKSPSDSFSPPYAPGSPGYAPESPPYAPGSPPYAPESPSNPPPGFIRGGNDGDRPLEKNETVYYVKSGAMGLSPTHPWTIRKVGDRFYTIETDLGNSGHSMKDSIQVVDPYEIYRATAHPPAELFHHHQHPEHFNMMNHSMSHEMEQTPKINIAPVIKIVNGPDNSTNNGEPTNESNTNTTATVNGVSVPVSTVSTGSQNIPSLPSKLNTNTLTNSESKPGSSSSDKSFLGGMIDFGKSLLIKKIT